jgi:hypothetical protein
LNSLRRIEKSPLRTIASKSVNSDQQAEILIADKRAGLTPADMVEQRLQALLLRSSLSPGTPGLSIPRADGHTRTTIAYTSLGEAKESASRTEANLVGQGGSTMYAISLEQSHATEILARVGPCPFRFWQTDHRGLLLIHARIPKLAKGVSASSQGSRANALVGVVDLMDCIIASTRSGDDPDDVEYHWLLANPRTFAQPLPYAGRLGIFLVSEKVVAAALRQVGILRWPQGG